MADKTLLALNHVEQLESTKAEIGEVKEENGRLKIIFSRIMKDYQTLQTHFFEIIQQEDNSKKALEGTSSLFWFSPPSWGLDPLLNNEAGCIGSKAFVVHGTYVGEANHEGTSPKVVDGSREGMKRQTRKRSKRKNDDVQITTNYVQIRI
ncbi:putative WRKY transcription factor 72 [Nymphaea thermarum]|nr:putative WRKY transcription factor 72 [Nymphaea thermarum]